MPTHPEATAQRLWEKTRQDMLSRLSAVSMPELTIESPIQQGPPSEEERLGIPHEKEILDSLLEKLLKPVLYGRPAPDHLRLCEDAAKDAMDDTDADVLPILMGNCGEEGRACHETKPTRVSRLARRLSSLGNVSSPMSENEELGGVPVTEDMLVLAHLWAAERILIHNWDPIDEEWTRYQNFIKQFLPCSDMSLREKVRVAIKSLRRIKPAKPALITNKPSSQWTTSDLLKMLSEDNRDTKRDDIPNSSPMNNDGDVVFRGRKGVLTPMLALPTDTNTATTGVSPTPALTQALTSVVVVSMTGTPDLKPRDAEEDHNLSELPTTNIPKVLHPSLSPKLRKPARRSIAKSESGMPSFARPTAASLAKYREVPTRAPVAVVLGHASATRPPPAWSTKATTRIPNKRSASNLSQPSDSTRLPPHIVADLMEFLDDDSEELDPAGSSAETHQHPQQVISDLNLFLNEENLEQGGAAWQPAVMSETKPTPTSIQTSRQHPRSMTLDNEEQPVEKEKTMISTPLTAGLDAKAQLTLDDAVANSETLVLHGISAEYSGDSEAEVDVKLEMDESSIPDTPTRKRQNLRARSTLDGATLALQKLVADGFFVARIANELRSSIHGNRTINPDVTQSPPATEVPPVANIHVAVVVHDNSFTADVEPPVRSTSHRQYSVQPRRGHHNVRMKNNIANACIYYRRGQPSHWLIGEYKRALVMSQKTTRWGKILYRSVGDMTDLDKDIGRSLGCI